jgi:Zn-dependent M28 family amino/carboxypeptidase
MISLEMIGYYSEEAGSQDFPSALLRLFYPSQGNFIALATNFQNIPLTRKIKRSMRSASSVPVYSINAPAFVPGIDFSDHRNFWAEGFPALMITDTAFYRNKAYHTQNDKPERLDYKRMAEVMSGVHQAVLDLANE